MGLNQPSNPLNNIIEMVFAICWMTRTSWGGVVVDGALKGDSRYWSKIGTPLQDVESHYETHDMSFHKWIYLND